MGSDLSNLTMDETRVLMAVCAEHGGFEQKTTTILGREFKTGCPECQRLRKDAEDAAEIAHKAHEAKIRMERKLGSAMIPKRFVGRTLDQYVTANEGQVNALRICRRYVEKFADIHASGRSLLMLGKPGTGKTHLAVAIANEIMLNTSFTAVYRTVGAILQAIRNTYDKGSDQTEAQILAGLVSPDLLVLDEIGVSKEKPSDFELTTLFAIINGRYEEQRPTIIVSNLDADQLRGAMGERCVDRLREGGSTAIKFDWESQRGKDGF